MPHCFHPFPGDPEPFYKACSHGLFKVQQICCKLGGRFTTSTNVKSTISQEIGLLLNLVPRINEFRRISSCFGQSPVLLANCQSCGLLWPFAAREKFPSFSSCDHRKPCWGPQLHPGWYGWFIHRLFIVSRIFDLFDRRFYTSPKIQKHHQKSIIKTIRVHLIPTVTNAPTTNDHLPRPVDAKYVAASWLPPKSLQLSAANLDICCETL